MRLFIFIIILFAVPKFQAQEKMYIDKQGNPVDKQHAELYREFVKNGNLYHIKDYYLNGQLQMEGYSNKLNIDRIQDFEGKYTFYYENGQIESTGHVSKENKSYQNTHFDKQGRIIFDGLFDSQGVTEGKKIIYQDEENPADEVFFMYRNGDYKRVVYDKDINKIRYEILFQDGETLSTIHSYDKNGTLIGTLSYDKDYTPNGIEVEYYYQPMKVKKIITWDKGKLISKETYYPNGQIFSKADTLKATFFDNKGTKKSELSFKKEDDMFHPYQGSEFLLNDLGTISQKIDYQLGNTTSLTQYYNNGNIKSTLKYDIDGFPYKIVFYTPNQKEKGSLTYQDGQPYNGIYYPDLELNDASTSYKEGTLVHQQNFDENKNIRFVSKIQDNGNYLCQIFDKKGAKTYEYIKEMPSERLILSQFLNDKIIRKAVIYNGIIEQGSISIFDPKENTELIIERIENWITIQKKIDNELVKEIKVQKKYFENPTFEGYISEELLSEYANMMLL